MKLVMLFVCLAAICTSAFAQEQSLEDFFTQYTERWGPTANVDAIVSDFWDAAAVIFPAGQPAINLTDQSEITAMLSATMQPVIEAGWQRTELLGLISCELRADQALVGIEFRRLFQDGAMTTDSAVYFVRSDEAGWKIQSVSLTDTSDVGC